MAGEEGVGQCGRVVMEGEGGTEAGCGGGVDSRMPSLSGFGGWAGLLFWYGKTFTPATTPSFPRHTLTVPQAVQSCTEFESQSLPNNETPITIT